MEKKVNGQQHHTFLHLKQEHKFFPQRLNGFRCRKYIQPLFLTKLHSAEVLCILHRKQPRQMEETIKHSSTHMKKIRQNPTMFPFPLYVIV